jgi:hypothetical protein
MSIGPSIARLSFKSDDTSIREFLGHARTSVQ